jgi:hypothetical protein
MKPHYQYRWKYIDGLHASSIQCLELSSSIWLSSVTMKPFQPDLENLIVALQSNRSLRRIDICGGFLAAIEESDQGRIFRSLGSLLSLQRMSLNGGAVSHTAIHMRVLADALSETSNGLKSLYISDFKMSSRSEVELLASGLKSRVESLKTLWLVDIVLDAVDRTGFLDPILLALAPVPGEPCGQLSYLRLSCVEAALNGASVVTPEALGAFFADEPVEMPRSIYLCLHNLGLNDTHCEVMAQVLLREYTLTRSISLDLTGNPSIGQTGYEVLLGLLNRRFKIYGVVVDDQNWKSTFDLVIFMNHKCHRDRFLENGVFPSKAAWMEFLEVLSVERYRSDEDETQKLNAIWYTLREDPDLIGI